MERDKKRKIEDEAIKGIVYGNELFRKFREYKIIKVLRWVKLFVVIGFFIYIIWYLIWGV
jgi:flagellar biogenesis protein FliO